MSVAFGAGLSIAMVLGITVAQRSAPDEMRGRVMSAVHVLSRICLIARLGRRRRDRRARWTGSPAACCPAGTGTATRSCIAGVALVGGGVAAKTGAMHIEDTPTAQRTTAATGDAGNDESSAGKLGLPGVRALAVVGLVLAPLLALTTLFRHDDGV